MKNSTLKLSHKWLPLFDTTEYIRSEKKIPNIRFVFDELGLEGDRYFRRFPSLLVLEFLEQIPPKLKIAKWYLNVTNQFIDEKSILYDLAFSVLADYSQKNQNRAPAKHVTDLELSQFNVFGYFCIQISEKLKNETNFLELLEKYL